LDNIAPLLAAWAELRESIGHLIEEGGRRVPPKVLVSLYRAFWRNELFDLSKQCATLLLGRPLPDGRCDGGWCEPIIRRTARQFGLTRDAELLQDFRQTCYHDVLDALDGREKGRPWDACFFRALKWAVLDAGRKMVRDLEREGRAVSLDVPEIMLPAQGPEDAPEPDLWTALQTLPAPLRAAAWLHWVMGYPVESGDPTQQTVATLMRKSGRMVRKYLRAARATLKTDPTIIELERERSTAEGADSSSLSCTGLALRR